MIEFCKKNIISIAILLLGITLLFVGTLKKNPDASFTITAQEMLLNVDDFEHVTNSQALKMQSDTNEYVFVDLRSPYDFEVKHIDNAINIPTAFLLDEENMSVFNEYLESGKTIVLYGQTERESISPWFLLYEIGITNTKVLLGGFDCFIETKDDCANETAKYDYLKISKQGGLKEVEVIKKIAPVKKKKAIPVQKKVKMEDEGGC